MDYRDIHERIDQWFREKPWSIAAWIGAAIVLAMLLVWSEAIFDWPEALTVNPHVRSPGDLQLER